MDYFTLKLHSSLRLMEKPQNSVPWSHDRCEGDTNQISPSVESSSNEKLSFIELRWIMFLKERKLIKDKYGSDAEPMKMLFLEEAK